MTTLKILLNQSDVLYGIRFDFFFIFLSQKTHTIDLFLYKKKLCLLMNKLRSWSQFVSIDIEAKKKLT